MPSDRSARITVLTVAACAVYAVTRYNLCKGVPWAQLPLYVGNKVLGLSALILLVTAAWRLLARADGERGEPVFRHAAWLMAGHVAVSLAIMAPAYYPKYYVEGLMSFGIEAAMLAGVLAALLVWRQLRTCGQELASAWPGLLLVPVLLGIHVAPLGWSGWWKPETWPGHMIPITLISTLFAGTLLMVNLRRLRASP